MADFKAVLQEWRNRIPKYIKASAHKKVAANGEYNLSGERYRTAASVKSTFKLVSLGSVCDLIGGSTPSKSNNDYWTNGTVKWISSKHIDERGSVVGYELVTVNLY